MLILYIAIVLIVLILKYVIISCLKVGNHRRSVISKLINLLLIKNNVQFDDENYLQVLGTAISTKMAPSTTHLYLCVSLGWIFLVPVNTFDLVMVP